MAKDYDLVYQFKVSLKNISPPIWRRIQVPGTYTFWDLHVAIQDVMGWEDYHLHLFKIVNPATAEKERIGIPDEEFDIDYKTLPGWKRRIARYFSIDNPEAEYVYDFGDNWKHEIEMEDILQRKKDVKYPVCIAGKRACPPEDCGSIWGYQDFLEIIMNPSHERHEEMLRWVGGRFDPECFDVGKVHFDDPKKRWKLSWG
ncbi:MAG: plasmid pRiA4b ORF-3 family protein [Deltaproteobacteria bacterium]|nr:plasmid pRiA4b ORF-3 family protein [Deltaproteobacteria bacterium]